MHTSLATVWSNHWPNSQHLQDERLNAWEACPWHGEESWKPNPAQAKENMISKTNFGRLEKNSLIGKLFPWLCLKTPVFPDFPDWKKLSNFSLISGNPVASPQNRPSWTLSNLCILICLVSVTLSCCCCSSDIVHPQLQTNNKITQ